VLLLPKTQNDNAKVTLSNAYTGKFEKWNKILILDYSLSGTEAWVSLYLYLSLFMFGKVIGKFAH